MPRSNILRNHLSFIILAIILSACTTSNYIVRKNMDLSTFSTSTTGRDMTVYCKDGDIATGGGCAMGVPTNGWIINICDPLGRNPESGSPAISPGSGYIPIGWRIMISGPAGSQPSSVAAFAVCEHTN